MAADGPSTSIEAVRTRPGMYVGDGGDAVLTMALEVIANACDQHFAGHCSIIAIDVAPNGTITITDDGPGMLVHGGNRLPPLRALLTEFSDRPTVDGHRPHVHLGRGGLGLFVVNALSERFELTTVRDGVEAKTIYARGHELEPLATAPTTRPTGTTIRFRPDPTIFPYPRVPRATLTERLEDLSFLLPDLTLRWHVAGDDLAAGGLAARIALHAACPLDDVATHRASFETPTGPIDVEVALTWLSMQWHANAAPLLHSFVNLERSPSHGTHVDGLIDGITAFFGRGRRQHLLAGVVAAVAVILSDVKWGNPRHERLDSPQARAPVAETTRIALTTWALAHPDAATALRDHKRR